jgi:hypothetical protein
MGIRKFPNPRFNLEQWRKLNGGDLSSWKGFEAEISIPLKTPLLTIPDT